MARAKKAQQASPAGAPKRSRGTRKKPPETGPMITVRHMNRRDIGRGWDFLKVSFRDVNSETVEFQRPRSKHLFGEIFDEEGIDQLVFEIGDEIVAYAECSYKVIGGSDNWINPRYFEKQARGARRGRSLRGLTVRAARGGRAAAQLRSWQRTWVQVSSATAAARRIRTRR
jgi:hypothetical protein